MKTIVTGIAAAGVSAEVGNPLKIIMKSISDVILSRLTDLIPGELEQTVGISDQRDRSFRPNVTDFAVRPKQAVTMPSRQRDQPFRLNVTDDRHGWSRCEIGGHAAATVSYDSATVLCIEQTRWVRTLADFFGAGNARHKDDYAQDKRSITSEAGHKAVA